MWDIVLDSLIDSAKAAPFLLAIYLLIEFLESNGKAKNKTIRLLNGKAAPLVAGGIGIIPQCGFSVMATDLYCQNYLKTGTLIAFFIATSDEALPILLTDKDTVGIVWIVLLVKIVYAIILGYLINLLDKRNLYKLNDADSIVTVKDSNKPHDHSHEEEHSENDGETTVHLSDGCCHHEMKEDGKKTFWSFVKHPLLHTLKIFVYIFVVNAIFGLLMYYFSEPIKNATATMGVFQSFVTAALGLVPNCASSVVIAGMYGEGIITLSACLAGLVSNSGIALAVLCKDRKQWRRNLLIIAIMYLSGVVMGICAYFVETAI